MRCAMSRRRCRQPASATTMLSVVRLLWISLAVFVHLPCQSLAISYGSWWLREDAITDPLSSSTNKNPFGYFGRRTPNKRKKDARVSSKPSKKRSPDTFRETCIKHLNNIVSGTVQPGPRFVHHWVYWLTAADAIRDVRMNDYTSSALVKGAVPAMYSRLFYFARLRPRLLYSVGALLRALQLCTPLLHVLDPSAGVGAGINVCALIAGSRWVKPLVLGWATTKAAWTWLGAQKVKQGHVPITLTLQKKQLQQV